MKYILLIIVLPGDVPGLVRTEENISSLTSSPIVYSSRQECEENGHVVVDVMRDVDGSGRLEFRCIPQEGGM